MIVDTEEHRAVILLALRNVQISGAAIDPELVRHIQLVHDVIATVESAEVAAAPNDPSVVSIANG